MIGVREVLALGRVRLTTTPVIVADWSAGGLLTSGRNCGKKRKKRPATPEIRPTTTPAFFANEIVRPSDVIPSGRLPPDGGGLRADFDGVVMGYRGTRTDAPSVLLPRPATIFSERR